MAIFYTAEDDYDKPGAENSSKTAEGSEGMDE
jgi:hypothetical protein